jgi:hypothetical protein
MASANAAGGPFGASSPGVCATCHARQTGRYRCRAFVLAGGPLNYVARTRIEAGELLASR